jgi:uncharacterized protein (DUF1778 family)
LKEERIYIRVSKKEKGVIKNTAAKCGKSISQYLLGLHKKYLKQRRRR